MRIKKYLVKSFDEALSSIKKELGDDAYIMTTRKIHKKGALSLGREEWLEVTAAVERDLRESESSRFSPLLLKKAYGDSPLTKSVKQTLPAAGSHKTAVAEPLAKAVCLDPLQPLREEISELKWLLQNQAPVDALSREKVNFPGQYNLCFKNLINRGVEQNLAVRLIDSLLMSTGQIQTQDENTLNKKLVDVISTHLGKAAPITLDKKNKLVVLVGPTGVGKTTTIAKLAAYFKLLEGKRIALASMDGFRIGGFAQLRTYGDLIDIPVFAVRDAADMAGVINRSEQYDLILFDSPGFSPGDHASLSALAEKISILFNAEAEIHLLLDATRKESDLKTVYQAYQILHPNRLIFSKVDESASLGSLFNIRVHSGFSVSYLTIGQRVPEDIEVAHPRRIASRLLGLFAMNGGRL